MPHEHHARTDELAKKLVISSTKILTKYFATALTAAFACIIFFPTSAQAQGFAPKKGALWAKLGYVYSTANSVYAGLDEVDFDAQNKVGDKVPFYNVEGDLVGGDLAIQEVALTAVYSP